MNKSKLLKLGHISTLLIPIKKIFEGLLLANNETTQKNFEDLLLANNETTQKNFEDLLLANKTELNETIEKGLNNKVDKISGKGLSTNDYTTVEKDKLATIENGAKKFMYIKEDATLYSHTIGRDCTASGEYSIATGRTTQALGLCSNAEGYYTYARGECSRAEGNHTTAYGVNQHTQGRWNIPDKEEKYAHIVGNGTSASNYSNAHTLDWDGLGWFAGGLKVGGAGQDDETAKDVMLAPATAAVGQTIVVKAVDANGKPTEWEATSIGSFDSIVLTDENTNKKYRLHIIDRTITMTEVE